MIKRDKQFERELERMLQRSGANPNVPMILTSLAKMIGEEIDRIEKAMTTGVIPATAPRLIPTSGTVVFPGNYPSNTASLVAGSTPQRVNFTEKIEGAFTMWWKSYNSSGEGVGITIPPSSIDGLGFTVTYCDSDCTIQYGTQPVV